MIRAEPSWELCRSFLAVMREGSLSRAAKSLKLTQPTVGRHVDELEQALGAALFTRSPRGLVPTPVASTLVPHAEAMASAAGALVRAASGAAEEERGAVRVTASEMIGVEVLPAIFAAFRAAHPRIDVELLLSNRTSDLLRREADIAVRMVQPTQGALVAKKLGSVRIVPHAHPRYLKAHGTPRSPEALREHPLIGFDTGTNVTTLPEVPFPIDRRLFSYRCDSDVAQYAAIKAGFGIGFCQVPLGRRDGLVQVLPKIAFELGVWLVVHQGAGSNKRVRLLFEHLASELRAYLRAEASPRRPT